MVIVLVSSIIVQYITTLSNMDQKKLEVMNNKIIDVTSCV